MAKGAICPDCGKMTFKKTKTGVRKCSRCRAVGWIEHPTGTGAGKGKECKECGEQKVHRIYGSSVRVIFYCSGCGTTYMPYAKK